MPRSRSARTIARRGLGLGSVGRALSAVAGTGRQDQHQDGQHGHHRAGVLPHLFPPHHSVVRSAARIAAPPVRSGPRAPGAESAHHTASDRAHSIHRAPRLKAPLSSGRMSGLPDRVRLVIFDLDGVIYRGSSRSPARPSSSTSSTGGRGRPLRDEQLDVDASGVCRSARGDGHRDSGRGDRHLHVRDGRTPPPACPRRALGPHDRRRRDGGRAAGGGARGHDGGGGRRR